MLDKSTPVFSNQILSVITSSEVPVLVDAMSLVILPVGSKLEASYQDIEHVYFPERGVLSVEATTSAGLSMQIAMIGREGASGMALVLGNMQWAQTTIAQTEVTAWKLRSDSFLSLISRNFRLRNALLRYTGVLAGQMASTALANGRANLTQRLARWILQMHSRLDCNSLEITHEAIAAALGVRRPGVTEALHILEGNHLVRATRGCIDVIDPDGLALATGGCYRNGD
jgi:CRP-like cAMP-binding protein